MALIKEINLNNTGVNLPDAYHVIRRVETYKSGTNYLSTLSLSVYASKDARDSGKDPVIENSIQMNNYMFDYDLSSNDNILKQAYDYLKTTPDYQGSADA